MKTMNNEVKVTETHITNGGLYASIECGKVSATVAIVDHGVRVVCHNASNRCWKGFGKHYASIADALNGYKSPAMKAIILAADALNH